MKLAIQVDLPTPPEPTRNLAKQFSAINGNVAGVNCADCRLAGAE